MTGVDATAYPDGRVVMKWSRSGNSSSAQFTVWCMTPSGGWQNVGSTSKVKITLEGFTPGVNKSFRVTSTVNNQTSPPSNVVQVYPAAGSGDVNLQIAA